MLPRTTPEQRSRFYDDVETLLSPGFLTHTVVIADVRLQIRTLSPGDLFMLRARASGAASHEWRIWLVASSIWMIDGRSVLGDQSAVPFLAGYLRKLPVNTVNTLFSLVLGLFARTQKAAKAAEVYVYERSSRYRWVTYGQEKSFEAPGVPGASQLGINIVQQVWQAFNIYEDQNIEDARQWEGFKLVASSNAPKAIKKMDERDKNKRQESEETRERDLDNFYYISLGVMNPDGGSVTGSDGSMHRIQGVKTVEDLEEDMRRWVTGDADLHDAVIRDYKQQIRDRRAAEAREREERKQFLLDRREEMVKAGLIDEFQPTPLIALTAEQLQNHLMSKGPGHRPGVTFIPKAPNAGRLYDKHVVGEATTSGALEVRDGKVVDNSANFETDKRTLNELIKGRNPSFGSGD